MEELYDYIRRERLIGTSWKDLKSKFNWSYYELRKWREQTAFDANVKELSDDELDEELKQYIRDYIFRGAGICDGYLKSKG
jgi:hypothetical protein